MCRVKNQLVGTAAETVRIGLWCFFISSFYLFYFIFSPDIQHLLCFWQEFLSLALIAYSLQHSPHRCSSAFYFTGPPFLLSATFFSSSFSHFRQIRLDIFQMSGPSYLQTQLQQCKQCCILVSLSCAELCLYCGPSFSQPQPVKHIYYL